ncbi:MAG: hypothetical protein QOJ53_819, partial [Sphingomonadales bacterium]|nr:hypothetical protein [Sphingomonadales bacterium]
MLDWILLQVVLPLGAPAFILLMLAFYHGKFRTVGFLQYFPTEGVGYFALTYMAA